MATFDQFLDSLDHDENRRGKQFEEISKWFLLNDPLWKTKVKKVWK